MDPQPEASTSTGVIKSGDNVLVRSPNGDIRAVKADKDTNISVGRQGSFHANEIIGHPFGFTYEIFSKKELKIIPPKTLNEVEDTDATNELINDGQFVQPLTITEITALKQAGVHADEIIKQQIAAHANYELKTEYSKEKYRKRKEAKYSKSFTTIEPTLFSVCEYWFNKDKNRIRDIRNDTLAQMLNSANIRPGGRYLAVDDASGLVVAGMLSRMGGEGRVITICDTDSPPAYPVMGIMNLSKDEQKIMSSLNWATAEEDYVPVVPPSELSPEEIRSDRHKSRLRKRKHINDALTETREELFSGRFDALIVATDYDPYEVLTTLKPYLSGSANIVVQSPYVSILADLVNKLRGPGFLAPRLIENWHRRYQVLPGRTHPTMNTSGTGGAYMHVMKVYVSFHISKCRAPTACRYDDPDAQAAESRRVHSRKKVKVGEPAQTSVAPETKVVVQVEDPSQTTGAAPEESASTAMDIIVSTDPEVSNTLASASTGIELEEEAEVAQVAMAVDETS
ncbi:Gcd10p-domain-containing protein [Cylindrobasidium torrendii FP15055 ss-10]|uniref:tRNA (adenine(58)-N(1))-methyltransferase non-catalytic subunit TRM6 n=1 Tax=Cylindrobasidium torrendii FP15055 ss-10 TaxID=1314674 RepID=A0A0D7BTV2_9AGAR|nr:Gcd10p-domain-containing protein [Cylindrobasidium torrendii FP15055 ss-10]